MLCKKISPKVNVPKIIKYNLVQKNVKSVKKDQVSWIDITTCFSSKTFNGHMPRGDWSVTLLGDQLFHLGFMMVSSVLFLYPLLFYMWSSITKLRVYTGSVTQCVAMYVSSSVRGSLKVRKHYGSFREEGRGWAKTRNCMAMFSL